MIPGKKLKQGKHDLKSVYAVSPSNKLLPLMAIFLGFNASGISLSNQRVVNHFPIKAPTTFTWSPS